MAKRLSWAIRIERAEKRGKFTPTEHDWAYNSWLTCAVGEKHGWPKDNDSIPGGGTTEYELGIDFGCAVKDDNIPEAKRLYAEIMALPTD